RLGGGRLRKDRRSPYHRSSMVMTRPADGKSEGPGRHWTLGGTPGRSGVDRTASRQALCDDDDALPRRIRTSSRTAPRGGDRRRHRAHRDSPRLGEIDAHAPTTAHTPTETTPEVRPRVAPSERSFR